jgi:hypothetical protein
MTEEAKQRRIQIAPIVALEELALKHASDEAYYRNRIGELAQRSFELSATVEEQSRVAMEMRTEIDRLTAEIEGMSAKKAK